MSESIGEKKGQVCMCMDEKVDGKHLNSKEKKHTHIQKMKQFMTTCLLQRSPLREEL